MKDRQRFNEQFIADLVSVWEKHGRAAMEQAAREDPTAFVRVTSLLAMLGRAEVQVELGADDRTHHKQQR